MDLSIAELARAVGRSEGYVRQHVHRKHLNVRRSGRSVSVALGEAIRWAQERGLTFVPPPRVSVTKGTVTGRTARTTVLVLNRSGEPPRNLFTLIRHRRDDWLGPWAAKTDGTWSSEDLGDGLRLFSMDAPLERCQELVHQIVESGTQEIQGLQIHYSLDPTPLRHWAYRDKRSSTEASVISPFRRHSAEVTEYWSLKERPRQLWIELMESPHQNLTRRLARLGFPLDRRSDRVGNLMISGAADTFTCDLLSAHDQTLIFQTDDRARFQSGAYRATVWASHSGNEVLREEVQVTLDQTVIPLSSNIDHFGFAVFRTRDGQCVDWMEVFLMTPIKIGLAMYTGPTVRLRTRQGRSDYSFGPPPLRSTIDVGLDDTGLQKEIRRLWLDRRTLQHKASPRNIVRFEAAEFDQAVEHFVGLLLQDADHLAPIYLADPGFLHWVRGKRKVQWQLYFRIFGATVGHPLHILCARPKRGHDARPWRPKLPNELTNHVTIRKFLKPDGKTRGFHDRYLITPRCETIITNSINSWSNYGVTFDSLPRGLDIYRAEAERLWSMETDSITASLLVKEID